MPIIIQTSVIIKLLLLMVIVKTHQTDGQIGGPTDIQTFSNWLSWLAGLYGFQLFHAYSFWLWCSSLPASSSIRPLLGTTLCFFFGVLHLIGWSSELTWFGSWGDIKQTFHENCFTRSGFSVAFLERFK